MTPIKTLALTLTGTVTAALATTAVLAAPAHASDPLQVYSSECSQTVYGTDVKDGRSRFECSWSVTGGTGTITATYTGAPGLKYTDHDGAYTYFNFYNAICTDNHLTTVTARFTDSTGAFIDSTGTITCVF
jgi:hypothetical protein